MTNSKKTSSLGVVIAILLLSGVTYGQGRGQEKAPDYVQTFTPWDKLPDWSGAWQMMGGTVFDRATQTGQGGAVNVGVREHPPYNAEWEAVYQKNLDDATRTCFPT